MQVRLATLLSQLMPAANLNNAGYDKSIIRVRQKALFHGRIFLRSAGKAVSGSVFLQFVIG